MKLISLYEYVKRNKEKRKSYSDFQDELINEQIFSGSYIRSFIPFLHNFGVIKDYEVVNYSDFFSMNGEMYIKNMRDADDLLGDTTKKVGNLLRG